MSSINNNHQSSPNPINSTSSSTGPSGSSQSSPAPVDNLSTSGQTTSSQSAGGGSLTLPNGGEPSGQSVQAIQQQIEQLQMSEVGKSPSEVQQIQQQQMQLMQQEEAAMSGGSATGASGSGGAGGTGGAGGMTGAGGAGGAGAGGTGGASGGTGSGSAGGTSSSSSTGGASGGTGSGSAGGTSSSSSTGGASGGTGSGSSGGSGSVQPKTGMVSQPTSKVWTQSGVSAAMQNNISGFPSMNQWQSFDQMWSKAEPLMSTGDANGRANTPQENDYLKQAIQTEAKATGIDPRVILAQAMQESSGHVAVKTTNNGVVNPGVMQSHNGSTYDPQNSQASILQMVKDGVEGTWGKSGGGPGLADCIQTAGSLWGGLRIYNSGSADLSNLNSGLGATPQYVQQMAHKLQNGNFTS